MSVLKFENITKSYGNQLILKDLSIEIEQGTTLAIVGPSGSGKTTFLNIAGALDVPDTGRLLFESKDLALLSENQRSEFRNKHVGFVFQQHYLLPQCTVLENILLPTLSYQSKHQRVDTLKRAHALLENVGMYQHKNKLPSQLSGGECQRTAFVRALINQPKVLLADEPTGSLDQENADILSNELIRLNKETGTTLIVVTHSVVLAQKMERILTLKHHGLY